jgi:hypothetical protein
VVSSRPPSPQKTKEKLKNPQQPNTLAVESQEGLKPMADFKIRKSRSVSVKLNLKKG